MIIRNAKGQFIKGAKPVAGFQKGNKINLGKKNRLGLHNSKEQNIKIGLSNKGKNKGIHPKGEFKKGMVAPMKGRRNIKIANYKHYSWKGRKAGYGSIHDWVRRWKGKPLICEHCGKLKTSPKSIQWSNIDHKYKRNLNDYISLCVKCHEEYDQQNNYKYAKSRNIT